MADPIHTQLLDALTPVLPNTWAQELPPVPVWPAAVYQVDSEPESAWVMGGGYTQHDVVLVVMSTSLAELDTLLPTGDGGPFRAALESMPAYQFETGCGDADYEPNPDIYARALSVRLRTPQH